MPENSGGYIYGTILVATLLSAEAATHDTFATIAGRVGIALVLYWLAISYSEYVGHRSEEGGHFELREFTRCAVHELTVVAGALGPLVAVLVCWAAGVGVESAIWVAIFSAAAIIIATELVLGLRSHLTGFDLVVQTTFAVLFGLMVVALRVLLH